VLTVEADKLGANRLTDNDFHKGGLFQGAIGRIRGQYIATMGHKRDFVRRVLNHMQDNGFVRVRSRRAT
jgi:hypothetical protein